MFNYQVEVLVESQEDYSLATKLWAYSSELDPEELSLNSNFEVMYEYFNNLASESNYVLYEILDWYLDDTE